MEKSMSKAELMEKIGERAHVSKKQAEDVMQSFEDIVYETLRSGGEVTLTGFGTFLAKERHSRMGVNPQKPTERIKIPAVTVPKFKAGKALKDALKQGGATAPAEPVSPPPAEPTPPVEPTPPPAS
ncbi:MAG: HU family DNA-binding protein [Patescibacteria group bacterium]|nr:HU family DNA-binding protein [Patescibacteria group bacterium]